MIENINTMIISEIKPGTVIEVLKNGVRHPGIVVTGAPEVTVIHNAPKSGVVICTLDEFCEGRRFSVSKRYRAAIPPEQIVANAQGLLGRDWHVTGYNCQHFVTDALGEKPYSHELRMGAGVLGLLLAAFVIGRKIRT